MDYNSIYNWFLGPPCRFACDTVDDSDIRLTSWWIVYPTIYRGFSTSQVVITGCLPSTVLMILLDSSSGTSWDTSNTVNDWDITVFSRGKKSAGYSPINWIRLTKSEWSCWQKKHHGSSRKKNGGSSWLRVFFSMTFVTFCFFLLGRWFFSKKPIAPFGGFKLMFFFWFRWWWADFTWWLFSTPEGHEFSVRKMGVNPCGLCSHWDPAQTGKDEGLGPLVEQKNSQSWGSLRVPTPPRPRGSPKKWSALWSGTINHQEGIGGGCQWWLKKVKFRIESLQPCDPKESNLRPCKQRWETIFHLRCMVQRTATRGHWKTGVQVKRLDAADTRGFHLPWKPCQEMIPDLPIIIFSKRLKQKNT